MRNTLERAPSGPGLFQPGMPRPGQRRALRSQEDGRAGTGASPSHGRVLIVEDEYFVALDTEDALSSAGFTVVGIAASAEEAIEMATAEAPDIVLMDIRLVGPRDGIDAAAEIRRRLGIPCLFATAHSDATTRARGDKAALPLGWLTKPYTQDEVAEAVGEAIAKSRRGAAGG
ncbi:response regulator [Roseicella aerolata]|uniref:Response regulator n=1 Tax=Roseicella aerolata TaxID=2883479 RepID=A0A9X1LAU5_9PROT|nr:response regulator [Roseicella aerolata]MCB4825401.1 response regulator [Roseicella aerolata]